MLRILIILFVLITILSAANDIILNQSIVSLGELWFSIHPSSLGLIQPAIQRYISPQLWDPGMIWVLSQSATVAFALITAVLFLVARVRARRK